MIAVGESHRRAAAYHEAGHVVAACCVGLHVESSSLDETKVSGFAPPLAFALTAAGGPVAVMFYSNVGPSTSATLSSSDRALIDKAGTSFGAVGIEARRLLQSQLVALESFAATLINGRLGELDAEDIKYSWWNVHDLDRLLSWRAAHPEFCDPSVHFEAGRAELRGRRCTMAMRSQRGEALRLRRWIDGLRT